MKSIDLGTFLAAAVLLASCDKEAALQPTQDDTATSRKTSDLAIGFQRVEFGTGGGFTGGGTGEFLRLESDGTLMNVTRKRVANGDDMVPRFDTAWSKASDAELALADSILALPAVRTPTELPDSVYDDCGYVFDGYYWKTEARYASGTSQAWAEPGMACFDSAGKPFAAPVGASIPFLRSLEGILGKHFVPRPI